MKKNWILWGALAIAAYLVYSSWAKAEAAKKRAAAFTAQPGAQAALQQAGLTFGIDFGAGANTAGVTP